MPVQVVPGEPEGTYRLKSDPSQTVYVPVETLENGTVIIPAQEPSGHVVTVDGQRVTELYGTQLGSNYVEDPVLGMVRFLPDNVSWLKWILGPWVGILAAMILFIATNAGIIGVSRLAFSLGQHRQLPRVLGLVHPDSPHAVRGHRGLRRYRRDPHLARRDHVPCGTLRVRFDDLVHRGARLGDHATAQGAGSPAAVRAPLNVRIAGHLGAHDRRVRSGGHLRRVVRDHVLQAPERR